MYTPFPILFIVLFPIAKKLGGGFRSEDFS